MFDMLVNIIKNIFSKPATRLYPKEQKASFKDTGGNIGINIDECSFCSICSKNCPTNAIVVSMKEKSWEIDPYKCISCRDCKEVCPEKCIINNEGYNATALVKEKSKFVQQTRSSKDEGEGMTG